MIEGVCDENRLIIINKETMRIPELIRGRPSLRPPATGELLNDVIVLGA